MAGPAAGLGAVPCDFHLVIHEATEVPFGCRSLSVSWRKGVKLISTGPATVHDGCAEWSRAIPVSCMLFRSAMRDGHVQFEAKFCWLEVTRDGGSLLGHAQLDLADFCDGQVHEQTLPVWKPSSSLGNLRLRVSIEARGSALTRVAPALALNKCKVASEVASAGVSPKAKDSSPIEVRKTTEDACYQDLETLLRSASAHFPAGPSSPLSLNLAPRRPVHRHSFSMGGTSGSSGRITGARPGPASPLAANLADLKTRLLALCNRQCHASGLTGVEQEDAICIFISELRRARDPIPSCGILFSTSPPPIPPGAAAPTLPAADGTDSGGPFRMQQVRDPDLELENASIAKVSPAEIASRQHTAGNPADASTSACLPARSSPVGLPAAGLTDVSSIPQACTTNLYELLSHLSDIRSLVLTLMPAEVPVCLSPTGGTHHSSTSGVSSGIRFTPVPIDDEVISPGSFMSTDLANAAATFAAAGPAEVIEPEEAFQQAEHSGVEATPDSAAPEFTFPDLAAPQSAGQDSPPSSPLREMPSLSPQHSIGIGWKRSTSQHSQLIVSQIIHGVDRATSIGEQALKDIGAEMGQLILRIHEVSCDRDLWAHRFLAAKELQYSSALCAQALQLSQADFTIQAF